MDGSRFDAWTRRRVGLVIGGGAVSLLGPRGRDGAAAKNTKRKRRCRRVQQTCRPGHRRKRCCNTLRCEEDPEVGGNRCCRPLRGFCAEEGDCCGTATIDCAEIAGLGTETRCCGDVDHDCTDSNDCCGNLSCRLELGRCEAK